MTDGKLEDFLSGKGDTGLLDSEGEFTIAADGAALKKLATYSLPFEGAWAVKIVQSMVAAGASDEIKISQGKTWTGFSCIATAFCTREEFGSALSSAHPSSNQALNHLIQGLRFVSMKEEKPFELSLPQLPESILWDGLQLRAEKNELSLDRMTIRIRHFSPNEQEAINWLTRKSTVARKNADVLLALRTRCFVSPVALRVDGLRVDDLLKFSLKGASMDLPLLLSFPMTPSPIWGVPPGTFAERDETLLPDMKSRWHLSNWSKRESAAKARVAILLATSLSLANLQKFSFEPQMSTLHWVKDGAVIEREHLGLPRLNVSLQIFLSAEELPTDLTGFQLRSTDERAARFHSLKTPVESALRRRDPARIDHLLVGLEKAEVCEPGDGAGLLGIVVGVAVGLAFPSSLLIKGLAAPAFLGGMFQLSGDRAVSLPKIATDYRRLQEAWNELMSQS